ncbi:xanthine dehydrogenase isoform X2 [Aedes albopictus]|uniref:FAD-binding PCMH-type domain-containing protein n=1 Tax=Aedes albopictus TaxID=7160 RepID=A0ABM1YKG7_AEDAL
MKLEFSINGKLYHINPERIAIETSLNTFIRNHAQLKGTKFMCLEGGCGSCIVNVTRQHPVTKEITTNAVNSCLMPIYACHGCDILTVEGIGSKKDGYHAVQKRLAEFNGSQCGFCSSGMVMSMFSLLEAAEGSVTMQDVESALDGNICRCTGYRPILDAFKSFAVDVGDSIKKVCQDIEDLGSGSSCSRRACEGICSNNSLEDDRRMQMIIDNDGRQWYKTYQMADILKIFQSIGNKPYMLVAGNTAHGVYKRSNGLEVFIDINSVKELHHHEIEEHLIVGANISINEFMKIIHRAVKKNVNFQYLGKLNDHLQKIANQPVRNSGTLAGNLMIKHEHLEFPSDLFLLLETVGATLIILGDDSSTTVTPQQFLRLDMTKKIISRIIIPQYDPALHAFRSFKIMPVSQNSRAYVNAGFLFKFSDSTLIPESVTICFGGINPAFVHASKTEAFLIGKPLLLNETLKEAIQILTSELDPDYVLPDASPSYRRNLAVSLFYKCILDIAFEYQGKLDPVMKSGATTLERPLSSGKQSYDTYPNKWPLTQNVPKLEGLIQCSGEAEYINDIPKIPNELFAAFVLATEINSRIVKIDASNALKVDGVKAFFSVKDIPGINNFMTLEIGAPQVEEVLCSGEVVYHGQPVGIIVAKTSEQAYRAANLVETCYEQMQPKPVYPTVSDVFESQAYDRVSNQGYDRHGAQFSTSTEGPIKINGRLDLQGQYHYTMETQTCFCIPLEDGMDVYSSTQYPDLVLCAVSQVLNVPQNSINLSVRRVGGAYGAKSTRPALIACACAVAAKLTQRPVRMVLPMETSMSALGKRIGCLSLYEVDVDSNGVINRLDNTYTHDGGSIVNENISYLTSDMFKNCYRTDNWNLVGNVARTDVPSNTWCRCPGTSEGIAMIENIMEHIAHVVGKDPMEVRMHNMPKENHMYKLLPKFRKDVSFDSRKKAIDKFNDKNRWRKRGIAIIPMEYPMEYSGTKNALVSIYHIDGSVAITHGAVEMGQGVNTKVAQVAASILGISLNKISVKPTTTLTSPNNNPSVHSRASETAAFAVKRCCEILLKRLQPIWTSNRSATWEQIINTAFVTNVDLTAEYHYQSEDLQGYIIWGCACAEVEVDILTGNVQVPRVDLLEDVGESMSPGIDIGQLEGSFIMGLGYYLTEALVYDPSDASLVNNRSWNYKVPGVKDIPIDFRVSFLKNSSNPHGVLRSKAVGEPSFSMTPVLTYALRYALRSARRDAGLPDDWIPIGSGTTPEKIFSIAFKSTDQYKLY